MIVRVSEVLAGGAVLVRPSWQSFDEAIQGLIDHLVAAGHLADGLGAEAVRRIREREAVASTAMVDIGVSIPHARLDGVAGITAAMAVSPDAVYHVAHGLPISIVVLVLSSPTLTGEHLNFLSALSLLLQSAQLRQRLRSAATPDDVLRVVRAHESARG